MLFIGKKKAALIQVVDYHCFMTKIGCVNSAGSLFFALFTCEFTVKHLSIPPFSAPLRPVLP
jgi:hypothetical protein